MSLFTPKFAGNIGLAINLGILPINKFFTATGDISRHNPGLWSTEGQVSVILWGMAYYAAGSSNSKGDIWLVFAIEKAYYVYCWALWMKEKQGLKKVRTKNEERSDDFA